MPKIQCSIFRLLGGLLLLCAAGALAQEARASSPDSQDSAFHRGLVALRDGHLETALAELTAAEQLSPSDAHIRNFRGVTLVGLGRNAEASNEYREAVRLDPRMADAYRNLGLLDWTEHRLDAAESDLRQALTLAPGDSFGHYYLGRVLLDSKDFAAALSELKQSAITWPEDADFRIQVASAYSSLGRQKEASKSIDQLLSTTLNTTQSIAVVDLLLSAERNDAAIQLLQDLIQRQTGNTQWARFDLAKVYLVAHKYENAGARAREYIEGPSKNLRPADIAGGWSLLGIAEANLKNSDSALEAFRQAARLQPGTEEFTLNLTRELMELGHYDEAIAVIQASLVSNPKSYALHLRLGAAYLAAGKYPDAEKNFRALVEANDPLPISYIGLAQVLLRTGRAHDAATELTAAERTLGPSFLIAYFRGLSLKQAGESEQAASAFTQAVRLNPSSAEAHRDLGSMLLILGRADDAIPELRESLRIAPSDVRTRRLLSRAYARSGDMKTAKLYLDAEPESPVPMTDLQGDFILPSWQYPSQEDRK